MKQPYLNGGVKGVLLWLVFLIIIPFCLSAFSIRNSVQKASRYKYLNKNCTAEVSAECRNVEKKTEVDGDGSNTTYSFDIVYSYGGRMYSERRYTHKRINEGDKLTICLDPDSPGDFMIKRNNDIINIIFWFVVGLSLFIAPFAAFYYAGKNVSDLDARVDRHNY